MGNSFFKYWLPLLCWMSLIFLLSHQDGDASQALSDWVKEHIKAFFAAWGWVSSGKGGGNWGFILRKCAHATEYAMLMFLGFRVAQRYWDKRAALKYAFVGCVCYAFTDELHQVFIPGRGASLWDVGIDSLGAAMMGSFLWGYFLRKPRLADPLNAMEK